MVPAARQRGRDHALEYRLACARRPVCGGTPLARAPARTPVSSQPWLSHALSVGKRPARLFAHSFRGRRAPVCGHDAAGARPRATRKGFLIVVRHTATSVVTIDRYIIEQERLHPEATGELSGFLYDIALAAKMISNKVRRAGLVDILGSADAHNVQGEEQQKLDVFANETIIKAMDHGGRLCPKASEDEPDIIQIQDCFHCRKQ